MWLIPIIGIAVIACGAVFLGFVPPPHAGTLLYIRGAKVRVARGTLRPHAREHIVEILSEVGVSGGFIAITPGNRVTFSRRIPNSVHQRL